MSRFLTKLKSVSLWQKLKNTQLLSIIQAVADRLAEIDEDAFEDPIRALDDALDEAGWPMAVVTSSTQKTADQHLTFAGIRARFHLVVTRDEVAHSKPAPDLYLLAADRLGVFIFVHPTAGQIIGADRLQRYVAGCAIAAAAGRAVSDCSAASRRAPYLELNPEPNRP